MRAGLLHDTYLEAYKISKDKQNFKDSTLNDEVLEKIFDIKNTSDSE